MKIVVFTSLLYQEVKEVHGRDRIIWGGAERYTYELCRLLREEGHDVAIYQSLNQTLTVNGATKRVPCGQLKKDFYGTPVVCLPDTDDGWWNSTNNKLNIMFNEIAIFFDLSIFIATFLVWPHAPSPSISICHGIFWDYPQHFIKNCNDESRREFLKRQLYGFTAPDLCVGVDSNIRKVIAALEPGSESNIYIIYNFVDTKKFIPAEKTWEGIKVLCPRRLTQLRGCNDFVKASLDYPQYEYVSVGQAGDKRLENDIKIWGETTSNLRFIYKPMEEMPEVYQYADIAVVPTRACEGLSLSLLESMSCGLPVITTPVGGLGDAVIPNYNALLYDPNHGGLGDCIDFLAQNKDVRQLFGKRNREIAVECFDIEIWRNSWRQLIKNFEG